MCECRDDTFTGKYFVAPALAKRYQTICIADVFGEIIGDIFLEFGIEV